MSRIRTTVLANDNDPLAVHPRGDAAGFKSMLREQELERRLQAPENERANKAIPITMTEIYSAPSTSSQPLAPTAWGLFFALLCLLCATLGAAYTVYSGQSGTLSIITLIAMVWSALWASHLAADEAEQRKMRAISEWTAVIAAFAGLGIWTLVSRDWGLAVSTADGIFGFSALATITAVLLSSRLTLLIAACSALAWVVIYTQIPSINTVSIWALPVLAITHVFMAGHNAARLTAFLSLLAVHGALAFVLTQYVKSGDISLLQAAAICLMLGLAHYRLGKASGDAQWETSTLHVIFGWGLAMAGAMELQHYWLGQDTLIWQNLASTPLGNLSWQIVGGASLALIGLAGIIRLAYRQMSTVAVLASLCSAVAAAALFDQRELITGQVTTQLNMSAFPLIGFIIGAAIFASALAMAINGARRKSAAMGLSGLVVIAAQLGILLDPNLWTAEVAMAFGLALVTSLCFAALFAADSQPQYV